MPQLDETIKGLKYDAAGLIPAVIVDADTKAVLMVAYMNETSLLATVRTGKTHFWSRSRQKYWMKGESSGHTLVVKSIQTDCDKDCVLLQVEAKGPGVCHVGYESCFFRTLDGAEWKVTEAQTYDPNQVYGGK